MAKWYHIVHVNLTFHHSSIHNTAGFISVALGAGQPSATAGHSGPWVSGALQWHTSPGGPGLVFCSSTATAVAILGFETTPGNLPRTPEKTAH